jgi:hypothetical protein
MRYPAPRLPFDDEAPTNPVIGVLVKPDDDCQCGQQVAVIEAASPPHAGGLVCYSCGTHRGWLPHHAYNFIDEIINQFGRPTEPVAYRRGPTSSTEGKDMKFDNTNRGSLFSNKASKKVETDPDFSGSINIAGNEYYLNGWTRIAKQSGNKFISLSVRPKQEAKPKPDSSPAPFDDEIGF